MARSRTSALRVGSTMRLAVSGGRRACRTSCGPRGDAGDNPCSRQGDRVVAPGSTACRVLVKDSRSSAWCPGPTARRCSVAWTGAAPSVRHALVLSGLLFCGRATAPHDDRVSSRIERQNSPARPVSATRRVPAAGLVRVARCRRGSPGPFRSDGRVAGHGLAARDPGRGRGRSRAVPPNPREMRAITG